MLIAQLFIATFIITANIQLASSAGICYKRVYWYERQAYQAHRDTAYGYGYKCGWRKWKYCRGTAYRRVGYTAYRSVSRYSSEAFCCSGYYGRPYDCRERPYVGRNPIDVTSETSSNVNFYVEARGYGPFTYQWYHNGQSLSNETSEYLYINNIQQSIEGSYYCRFCNHDGYCASTRSAQLTVTVNPPVVTLHPVSQTIALRTNNYNMSLSCQARGHNLEYLWERLNATLPNNTQGINTSMLNFTFLSPGNAGKYRCKVFNSSGFGYSDYAVLNIHAPAPQIIIQPMNTTAADPFGAHFTCTANGYGDINIYWKRVNENEEIHSKAVIAEERSRESVTSTLFIPNVVMQDEGGYYCAVWTGLVSTLSQTAYLQEIMTPLIMVNMDNNTVNLLVRNYNLTMRCIPSDTDLDYKWRRRNTSLPVTAVGLNTSTLTIYRLTPKDAGDYQCILSNASGVISSEWDTLRINVPPPEILIPPQNISAAVYSTITFSCTGRGFGDVKVVWTKPPSKVTSTAVYVSNRYDDQIASTITISHVVDIYSGQYCCAVENHVGSSEIVCADLNIEVPCPEISLSPINNTIIVEEDTTFICQAFSFGTIEFEWERVNSTIPAKSSTDVCSSTLTIPNATQFDEGLYCCIATNECGPVKECAVLSVVAIPIITLQPNGAVVHTGAESVEMNCSAVGHSTISYHWEKYNSNTTEWTALSVYQQIDTNGISTYTIEMLNKSDDGLYRCAATNIDGTGYSRSITVTVYGAPSIMLSSTKVDAIEGHEMTLTCTATNDINSPFDANVTWFGPTGQVIESGKKNIIISNIKLDNVMTSAIKFKPINHTQAGINKCKASNHPNSSNEMNFTVMVDYAPIVHITPSKSPFVTEVGPDFLLHCSAEGRPSPSIQWYKNGQPLSTRTSRSTQEIYVPRSSSSDSALYECSGMNVIENRTQERKSVINFQVVDPMEGPCAVNNGGCDHICTVSSEIVKCYCRVGYFSIAFLPSMCFDVDECLLNLDKCEDGCTNTPGSYKCSCPYGQVLASNGYDCIKCADDHSSTNFAQILPAMPVNITETPWHVAVCKHNATDVCSGSLINDKFIITAASCVCSDISTSAELIMVKMNKSYDCLVDEPDTMEYEVTQIICHPMYSSASSDYNIALLKLSTTLNNSIFGPICLPMQRDTTTVAINSFARIYGYKKITLSSSGDGDGSIADNNSIDSIADGSSTELSSQVAQFVSNNECNVAYNKSESITSPTVCTTSGMMGECWESSGAPLVVSGRHVILAGMVYSNEVDKCKGGGSHVIHTKLDGFQDWILDQISTITP